MSKEQFVKIHKFLNDKNITEFTSDDLGYFLKCFTQPFSINPIDKALREATSIFSTEDLEKIIEKRIIILEHFFSENLIDQNQHDFWSKFYRRFLLTLISNVQD